MGIQISVLSENIAGTSYVLAEFGDRFFSCNAGTIHDLL